MLLVHLWKSLIVVCHRRICATVGRDRCSGLWSQNLSSTVSSSNLPNELWLQIVQYILNDQLYQMIGLNKFFLEVGMDVKWRSVKLDTESMGEAMHLLKRLQDPFVAKRVKVLLLCMGYFKHDVGKSTKLKRYFLGQYKQKHTPTFKDAVSSLISIVPLLSSVDELEIELWYAPSDILVPLFQSVHTSFGKRLDRLLIRGHLDGIWVLVSECTEKFEHLRGLHVELMNRLPPENQRVDVDENTLVSSVAPFIRSLAPTLEVLRIWTWASVDFSRFYDVLATTNFPALKSVYIRMAFNDMLRQPESLKAFLSGCGCTLEKLELRLNNSRGMQLDQSNEEPLGKWLEDFVGKESDPLEPTLSFPKLQALDFYPSTAESGTTALLSVIHRSVDTLLELTIRDRYFYPDQARTVINAAAKCRLRYFRMNVMYLDVELLDLLMEKLPGLEKIWLSLSKVMGSGEHSFHQILRQRKYHTSKIRDISLWQGGQQMESETMTAMANALPLVNSFFGSGLVVFPQ